MNNKMIIVRQRDVKDCGPCALQSIIRYYGGYVSIEKIRLDTLTSIKGTSVYHLQKAAEKYGFDAVAKKYEIDSLDNIIMPAIVHVKYDNGLTHFMCLYEIKKDYVILMDPSKGKVKMKLPEFNKIFSGVVLELQVKNKIVLLEKESNIYALFSKIIISNKKLCLNIIISSLLLMIFTMISGFYFKVMYNSIENMAFENTFKIIIFIFLIVVLLKIIFEYIKKYYLNHISKNIDVNIYQNFITHIFHLPLNVIKTRLTGEIISRINEINNIKDLFSEIIVSVFLDSMISIGALFILFSLSSKLSSLLVICTLIFLMISLLASPYIYKRIRQNIDYQTNVNSILIENVDMLSSIKNLNEEEHILKKIESKISGFLYDNYSFISFINFLDTIKNLVYELSYFIINTVGFYLIINGKMPVIDLVIFNMFLSYFIDPVKNIIEIIPKYNFLRATFNKICDFIDLEEEKNGKKEKFINGDIVFNNVDLSYDSYEFVLKKFNERINVGEKVMLKGISGSGKSSICKMLIKNYFPNSGEILINNYNLNDYSNATIKDNIIYVGQNENLYTDTIKNNIIFNYNNISNFNKVCKICMIDSIVNKRKFRYESGISNDSLNISGGEKQRIILARALLRNSKILILDEALSETDYYTERQILKNIMNEYPNKTLIYVSHKKLDDLFKKIINVGEIK